MCLTLPFSTAICFSKAEKIILFLLLIFLTEEGESRHYYNYSEACTLPQKLTNSTTLFQPCSHRGDSHMQGTSGTSGVFKNHDLSAISPSTLRDRTFVFIGDSTMGMQHHAFCTSLSSEVIDLSPGAPGSVPFTATVGTAAAAAAAAATTSNTSETRHAERGDPDVEGEAETHLLPSHDALAVGRTEGAGGGTQKSCHLQQHNSTALFLGYGRLFQWEATLSPKHLRLIASTVAGLGARDIVLFSVGAHWPFFCASRPPPHLPQQEELASMSNFEHALLRVLDLLLPSVTSSNSYGSSSSSSSSSSSGSGSGNGSGCSAPLIVYREALPQHFVSSNGHYPSSPTAPPLRLRHHRAAAPPPTPCADLNEDSVQGLGSARHSSSHITAGINEHHTLNSTLSKPKASKKDVLKTKTNRFVPGSASSSAPPPVCNPNCLPASWQNDLAERLLADLSLSSPPQPCYKESHSHGHSHSHNHSQRRHRSPERVGILRVFRSLECLSGEHSKKNRNDCTHYSPRVNSYLNFVFLQYIHAHDSSADEDNGATFTHINTDTARTQTGTQT